MAIFNTQSKSYQIYFKRDIFSFSFLLVLFLAYASVRMLYFEVFNSCQDNLDNLK